MQTKKIIWTLVLIASLSSLAVIVSLSNAEPKLIDLNELDQLVIKYMDTSILIDKEIAIHKRIIQIREARRKEVEQEIVKMGAWNKDPKSRGYSNEWHDQYRRNAFLIRVVLKDGAAEDRVEDAKYWKAYGRTHNFYIQNPSSGK